MTPSASIAHVLPLTNYVSQTSVMVVYCEKYNQLMCFFFFIVTSLPNTDFEIFTIVAESLLSMIHYSQQCLLKELSRGCNSCTNKCAHAYIRGVDMYIFVNDV